MKMNKMLAFGASLVLLSSCVSLPAFAEDFSEQEFYVVSRNSPAVSNICYLHCYSEKVASISEYAPLYQTESIKLDTSKVPSIEGEKASSYVYGDILIINAPEVYDSDDSYPPRYYLHGVQSTQYAGNCKDIFETKKLTLTDKKPYSWNEGTDPDSITFTFTDSEGKEYQYLEYYYTVQPEIDLNLCSVGDTVTFSVYQDTLILPLDLEQNITVKPVSAVTANGDADGNGALDILDIITVNKAILGKENLDAERIPYIDFNQNQVPDSDDALTMLKMIVGLA